ncbi:GPI ethanolamine phosphate transferase 2-like isoform X2 [Physella acuta]|nr:GPI ethanolamine phosphate transferase 2-like isoform X2 [Physella acuta]
MVIDAFRADFMFGPYNFMPYTKAIVTAGHGLQFTAEAYPPTVTLPQIKAITTGSTQSFVDVILNFGASELEEDNFVAQFKKNGFKIIFFGDDTWLKLFPGYFDRYDGTTSFFVSDFTEVDKNVTRHVIPELDNPSWDVMILHYLGLDHIGHISGPNSHLIQPKLAEMDKVVHQIYTSMMSWDKSSILVVCGDHGMSDQGGHGGASLGEVSVPVLFLSPQYINKDPRHSGFISQNDICATVSVLMGIPIPINNIGKVLLDTLSNHTIHQKIEVMHQNAQQAIQVLENYISNVEKDSSHILYTKAEIEYQSWLLSKTGVSYEAWEKQGHSIINMYSESLTLLAEKVRRLATQYDVYAMSVSMVLMWLLVASLLINLMRRHYNLPKVTTATLVFRMAIILSSALLSHITMCTGSVPSDLVCSSSLYSVFIQLILAFIYLKCCMDIMTVWHTGLSAAQHLKIWIQNANIIEIFLVFGTVVHTMSLLSSSFIEEEHQTLYFLLTSVHVLLLVNQVFHFICHLEKKKNVNLDEGKATIIDQDYLKPTHKSISNFNSFEYETALNAEAENISCDTVFKDNTHLKSIGGNHGNKFVNSYLTEAKGIAEKSKISLFLCNVSVVLIILRILRRWNQTGNKWLDVPDFGDWFILPENKNYLSLVVVFSLMIISVTRTSCLKRAQSLCINLSLATIYLYRVACGNLFFPVTSFLSSSGIVEARAAFLLIGLALIISILPNNFYKLESQKVKSATSTFNSSSFPQKKKANNTHLKHSGPNLKINEPLQNTSFNQEPNANSQRKVSLEEAKAEEVVITIDQRMKGFSSAFLCFMCLVSRPQGIPVLAFLSVIEQIMIPILMEKMSLLSILIYCYWMGNAFFFFQGNSNSLSTIDLTSGYTGLYESNFYITGPLLCMSTYGGTIFWFMTYIRIIFMLPNTDKNNSQFRLSDLLTTSGYRLLLCRAFHTAAYTSLVSVQRYHLFVWSVFSPKLLYESAYSFVTTFICIIMIVLTFITK